MSNIGKRLVALEAAAKPATKNKGAGIIVELGGDRWYGGSTINESRAVVSAATCASVAVVVNSPVGCEGVLAAAIRAECSTPDILAEVLRD